MPNIECHPIETVPPKGPQSPDGRVVRLGQSWLPSNDPALRPGIVVVNWLPDALVVSATLVDDDVFSDATEDNQRTWELGDAFEVFLGQEGTEDYVEIHVTPNNHQLRLKFPDGSAVARSRASADFSEFLIQGGTVKSMTTVMPQMPGWSATITVPSKMVTGRDRIEPGEVWRFSFCRYDATRGAAAPVLSSTSAYAELDFHRLQEWGRMRFVE